MEKTPLTTKGAGRRYLIPQLFSDVLYVVLGVVCAQMVTPLKYQWQFKAANAMSTLSVLFFGVALVSILYHVMVSQTVVEMQERKITGKGLQGISNRGFSLEFDQIVSIATSKGFLNLETGKNVYLILNTISGNYKIIATPDCAKEFVEYYNNNRK